MMAIDDACTDCVSHCCWLKEDGASASELDITAAAALQRRATPQRSDVSLTHEAPFMLMGGAL